MLPPKPIWLQPLFPWEQQARQVNGRSMAFVDAGTPTARPVLLLHGNPTWGYLYCRAFLTIVSLPNTRLVILA